MSEIGIEEFRAEDQPAGRKRVAYVASHGKTIQPTEPRRKKSFGCSAP